MERRGKLKKHRSNGNNNITLRELVASRRKRTLKLEEMLSQARMDMESAINNAKSFSLSISSLCSVEKQVVPQKSRSSTLPISVDDYGKIETDRWNVRQKSRASTFPISVSNYGKIDTDGWLVQQKYRASTLPISVDDYGKIDTDRWLDTNLDVELCKTRSDKDLITRDEKQDNVEFLR